MVLNCFRDAGILGRDGLARHALVPAFDVKKQIRSDCVFRKCNKGNDGAVTLLLTTCLMSRWHGTAVRESAVQFSSNNLNAFANEGKQAFELCMGHSGSFRICLASDLDQLLNFVVLSYLILSRSTFVQLRSTEIRIA